MSRSAMDFYYILQIFSKILLGIQINYCYRKKLARCLFSQWKSEDYINVSLLILTKIAKIETYVNMICVLIPGI